MLNKNSSPANIKSLRAIPVGRHADGFVAVGRRSISGAFADIGVLMEMVTASLAKKYAGRAPSETLKG